MFEKAVQFSRNSHLSKELTRSIGTYVIYRYEIVVPPGAGGIDVEAGKGVERPVKRGGRAVT